MAINKKYKAIILISLMLGLAAGWLFSYSVWRKDKILTYTQYPGSSGYLPHSFRTRVFHKLLLSVQDTAEREKLSSCYVLQESRPLYIQKEDISQSEQDNLYSIISNTGFLDRTPTVIYISIDESPALITLFLPLISLDCHIHDLSWVEE